MLWSEVKVKKYRIDHVKALCKLLDMDNTYNDQFLWDDFRNPIIFDKVKALTVNLNRMIMMVTSLVEVMAITHHEAWPYYNVLLQSMITKNTTLNMMRMVIPFQDVVKLSKMALYMDGASTNLRVFAILVLSNLTPTDHNTLTYNHQYEIGILRPSDLINTTVASDMAVTSDTTHKLYLHSGVWNITANTKNKCARTLQLSPDTCSQLAAILKNGQPLMRTMKGEKYATNCPISLMVQDWYKVTFNEIRASYFTWRSSISITSTMRAELSTLCYRQGHLYTTAMSNYLRGTYDCSP